MLKGASTVMTLPLVNIASGVAMSRWPDVTTDARTTHTSPSANLKRMRSSVFLTESMGRSNSRVGGFPAVICSRVLELSSTTARERSAVVAGYETVRDDSGDHGALACGPGGVEDGRETR